MRALVIAAIAACGSTPPRPIANTPHAAVRWGTAAPYRLIAVPPDGRWGVFCQARDDSDHDGQLHVFSEMHGEEAGDALVAYLVDPDGRETVVENVLATDRNGTWLVVVEHRVPILIDTRTWHRTPIAGTLPRSSIVTGRTDWTFSPDGARLLFWRDGSPVVRELATGSEVALAPAWEAAWSGDGAWVELGTLAGDTNRDGFTHGPNLEPYEGMPGENCGRKREYPSALTELLPGNAMNDPVKLQAALDSIDHPDELVRTIYRIADGRVVSADHAIDRDTIMATDAIGPVDGTRRSIGSACSLEATYRGAALVRCNDRRGWTVQWIRGSQQREVYRGAEKPLVLGEPGRWRDVWAKPTAMLVDLTTGTREPTAPARHLAWSDDTRYATDEWDDDRIAPLELVAPGHPALAVKDGDVFAAGHWLVVGAIRIDLDTLEHRSLGTLAPIRVREDGAVLVDGGPEPKRPNERSNAWRMGPLRWLQP